MTVLRVPGFGEFKVRGVGFVAVLLVLLGNRRQAVASNPPQFIVGPRVNSSQPRRDRCWASGRLLTVGGLHAFRLQGCWLEIRRRGRRSEPEHETFALRDVSVLLHRQVGEPPES